MARWPFGGRTTCESCKSIDARNRSLALPLDDHRFICLPERPDGGGDARATKHLLNAGERCTVPPMTAHHVHGLDGGPCQFMVLQGTGVYDNVRVGGASD